MSISTQIQNIGLKPKLTTVPLEKQKRLLPVSQHGMKLKLTTFFWEPLIYIYLKEDLGIKHFITE